MKYILTFCISILITVASGHASTTFDLGGFEEGDMDNNGIADSWTPNSSNEYLFDVSLFSREGVYSQRTKLYSEQGYIFGEWYENHVGSGLWKDIENLESNSSYDFRLYINPSGDSIDDIENFHYRISVGVRWWDAFDDMDSKWQFYYVGTDLILGQWNEISINVNFADVDHATFLIGTNFYRTDSTPGEWETSLYFDTPIPEPSMVLMILGILFVSRKARRVR